MQTCTFICCLLDKFLTNLRLYRVSYNVVPTSVVSNQWKNQENVSNQRISAYSAVKIILCKVKVIKYVYNCLFLKDVMSTDFLLAKWEATETDLGWERTSWASHFENQKEALRRGILSSYRKNNLSH